MSVFTLQGHMVVFTLKQAAEWEVREIGSSYLPNRAAMHLLFGLNLSLTPRCPLRLRDAICFLFFLPKEGRQAPLPLRCNLWSEKKVHDTRAELQLCTVDASRLQVFFFFFFPGSHFLLSHIMSVFWGWYKGVNQLLVAFRALLYWVAWFWHLQWVGSHMWAVRSGGISGMSSKEKKKKNKAGKSIGTMTTSFKKKPLNISSRELHSRIINSILFTY